jgi:hypothetical protein
MKQQGGNRDIEAEVGARGNYLEAVHVGYADTKSEDADYDNLRKNHLLMLL